VLEGTPTIKGSSPIERYRLAGSNCRYYVPCPHCKRYQWLEFGSPDTRHGVKWDKTDDGRSDPARAEETARYACRHGSKQIHDHHRGWMMRRGVWVPEGCEVHDKAALRITETSLKSGQPEWTWNGWQNAEWIKGTPVRDSSAASYHLSTLYALAVGWGDCARAFVEAKGSPPKLRNVVNQWFGNTWEILAKKTTWEQLGDRWINQLPHGVAPADTTCITIGVDKQQEHYVYVVTAWGPNDRPHDLAYGYLDDHAELEAIIATRWSAGGGSVPAAATRTRGLQAELTLIDSGYRPKDVHDFVDHCAGNGRKVAACRGSSTPLGALYTIKRNGKQSANPGRRIIWVDTSESEEWIDKLLHTLKPDDPGAQTLHAGSLGEHEDFLVQCLNGAQFLDNDSRNQARETWKRIDENIPNDYRDAKRYAYVAMKRTVRGRQRVVKPEGGYFNQQQKRR